MGQSKSGWLGALILTAFLSFVVVMIVVSITRKDANEPVFPPPEPPKPSPVPERALRALAPAERMERIRGAKDVLSKPRASSSELASARSLLQSVTADQPEFKQAKTLIKQLDKKVGEATEREDIDKNPIKVVSQTWERGGFETVALWKVTFHNRSAYPVGNIRYRTEYFAETGAKVDSSKNLIQKIIQPHQRRTIEVNDGFMHREAFTANFSIEGWEYIRSTNTR